MLNFGKDKKVNEEKATSIAAKINENYFSNFIHKKKINYTIKNVKINYLTNLNEKQQEAVMHLNGPLLIVAGAELGKTKVLTSRIAHIIKTHKLFLVKY